ncbi:MAG: hypothetical protein LCH54_05495 [Bacteroidetes bacterium]|nr:hypothetical protein [Bacteroidota bacterium]
MNKTIKILLGSVFSLILLYVILLIPDQPDPPAIRASEKPFIWNQNEQWQRLETQYLANRTENPAKLDSFLTKEMQVISGLLSQITNNSLAPSDSIFKKLEITFFQLAPAVAVRQHFKEKYLNLYSEIRIAVKHQSQQWDMTQSDSRITLYRLLYGMRAATEEVLLQSDSLQFNPALFVEETPSQTPSAELFGIVVHSGDLLVSRGGFEISALISRGNDFPGNFSHVALVHVDEQTGVPSLIEAHIEKGVAIASSEQYKQDKKLRFMVLRPRADLPGLIKNPMLPHQVAEFALSEAKIRHIPYDFKMNYEDSSALFCSEVGSFAYRKMGIQIWKSVSTISSQGIVNWLNAFGVENFVTQMPSDLEYDPQLAVVAEWRDPETLLQDHVYSAVMDALIEKADAGEELSYNPFMLPFIRIFKAYCWTMNQFGNVERIPEGMSSTIALKNQEFVSRFQKLRQSTETKVDQFRKKNGYLPPYWQMIQLARE